MNAAETRDPIAGCKTNTSGKPDNSSMRSNAVDQLDRWP